MMLILKGATAITMTMSDVKVDAQDVEDNVDELCDKVHINVVFDLCYHFR